MLASLHFYGTTSNHVAGASNKITSGFASGLGTAMPRLRRLRHRLITLADGRYRRCPVGYFIFT